MKLLVSTSHTEKTVKIKKNPYNGICLERSIPRRDVCLCTSSQTSNNDTFEV
jgi:hypothetical protein